MLKTLFSSPKFSSLNTAAKEFYLSDDEKQVVALFNLARYDSKTFIKEVILNSGYDTSISEVSDLIKEFKNRKSIFPLMPAFSLFKAAMMHAKDMGESGLTGHHSSDGKNYQDRIHQYVTSNTLIAENYLVGSGDPVDVVMSFLLQKGENGTEYKRNILDENIHYIGISIKPHRLNCSNTVVDFARKPIIPVASAGLRKKNAVEVYWKDCPTGTKISTKRKSGGFSLSNIFRGRRK